MSMYVELRKVVRREREREREREKIGVCMRVSNSVQHTVM